MGQGQYLVKVNTLWKLVNLTTLPEIGHRFVGWSDLGNGFLIDQNITHKIKENTVFEANFEPESYTLTIHSSSGLVYGAEYTYDYRGIGHPQLVSPLVGGAVMRLLA